MIVRKVVQRLRETLIELRHRYAEDDYPVQSWQRSSARAIKAKLLPLTKPSAKRPSASATVTLPTKRPRKKEAPKLKINTEGTDAVVRQPRMHG